MKKNKIEVLNQSAQSKREKTFIKVKTVLKVMHDKELPINFASVAKLAQVSKTWLYQEPMICAEIKRARNKGDVIQRTLNYQSVIEKKDHEIMQLKTKNKEFQEHIKQLQQQLEIVHGELYKLKHQYKLRAIK
jgi:uncharacterized coiled-coil DUF342 family protein